MIECVKYRPYAKGTLQGFADLKLPNLGLEFYSCTVHMKNGQRWVNLPSREYENEQGERKYSQCVRYTNAQDYQDFIRQALKAIDLQCGSQAYETQDEPPPF